MRDLHERLADAAQSEIFREKTLRYKRNSLVLGVVLIASYGLSIDFSDMNLLGAKLPKDAPDKEFYIFWALWLAFIYNFSFLVFMGIRDWKHWAANLTRRVVIEDQQTDNYFPELRMYFGKNPTRHALAIRFPNLNQVRPEGYETNGAQDCCCVACVHRRGKDERIRIFCVPLMVVHSVRRQLRTFMLLEIIVPAIILIPAIGLLVYSVLGLC